MSGSGVITPVSTIFGLTTTRAELRRLICQELHMPFTRRFNGASTVTTGSVSPHQTFCDSKLIQPDKFWNENWFFRTSTGEVRKILEFYQGLHKIKLEYPLDTALDALETYEIHSIWNANEIHSAINQAIEDGYPNFFNIVTDETLVLKENTLTYSLSGLTYLPWIVAKVWIESPTDVIRGTAASSTPTTLTDPSANFTGVSTNYKISIYAGTGAGQLRSIASVTGTTTINVPAWGTLPDTTSKYVVWDSSDQLNDWTRLQNVRFNSKENPTLMYLTDNYDSSVGSRIRLEYVSIPTPLATESSITCVPKEFILHKALYYLFSQKINDNRADRQRYESLAQRQMELAEFYRQGHTMNMPDLTLWTPGNSSNRNWGTDGNPIGWSNY